MSGGSMQYLWLKIEDAEFEEDTPLRIKFKEHLLKVANALRIIELVDSNDSRPGAEEEAIKACFQFPF